METIFAIAKNTFRQTIRDKILYGILIFAFLFIGSTVVLSSLALEDNIFIIRTFGLAGIYIFGLIITIFLGASLIYDEVEKKTTYILLAKPVTRARIIIGKFLGLLASISMTTLLMAGAYLIVIYSNGGGLDYMALASVLLQLLEMTILISILTLFSVFTTPLASIIYTILIVYIGHSLGLILSYTAQTKGLIKATLTGLYYILPNFEKFNIRDLVVHGINVTAKEISFSIIYALAYVFFILYIAKSVFDKKDL